MKFGFLLAPMLCGLLAGQQDAHAGHAAGVDSRGDHVMGFSHEATTHHFRLMANGGSIEVLANDPKDRATRDQIRTHLAHIAQMFSNGNFEAPMLIHDRTPPGVPELVAHKDEVRYRFEKTMLGGTITIVAKSEVTLKAVHEFLRFQISDHGTGDSISIGPRF